MNLLLLLFALPIATIIFSIVLQKIIRSPILVALTIFAIFLIVTFAAFDESFLIYTILYTILSYITAMITRLFKRLIRRFLCNQNNDDDSNNEDNSDSDNDNDCNRGHGDRASLVVNRGYTNKRYWR